MNVGLEKQAEKLAAEPYTVEIMRDETTTGEPIFLLSNPELPGCMAQGHSIEEAAVNLEDARKEYILSILEDGLPVPLPSVKLTETTSGLVVTDIAELDVNPQEPTFLDDLSRATQPKKRQWVGAILPQV